MIGCRDLADEPEGGQRPLDRLHMQTALPGLRLVNLLMTAAAAPGRLVRHRARQIEPGLVIEIGWTCRHARSHKRNEVTTKEDGLQQSYRTR